MFGISAGIIGSASGFDPLDLNPVLLLDAGQGVTESGGLVSSWANQGTGSTDATQATGSAQPTYNASGFGVNSKPYLDFDGTADFLTLGTEYSKLPNYTVFAVFETDDVDKLSAVYADCDNVSSLASLGSTFTFFNSAPSVRFGDGSDWRNYQDQTNSYSNNTPYLFAQQKQNGSSLIDFYVDGFDRTSDLTLVNGTATNVGGTKYDMAIGRLGERNLGYFNGKIAEIIIYDKVLTTQELTDVNNFLKNKYGI